jgi:CheY-like chemotaxis protein
MDINLPGISGIDAINAVRKDPLLIALSANAMRNDIDRGMEAGFFRYLTKPIKINELLTALTDALKMAKSESP